jgi:RNA polymerase sigma-70 factor (ECF subfamily)
MDLQPAVMGDPAHDAPLVGRGVEAAVLSLSPPLRAAFLLRELHGFDYADIAEALDVDLGTVKSRLSRARARLREALGGET